MSIKLGDTFTLGDHLLICGDATDQALIERHLNGQKIDLILTDPPYGVSYVESKDSLVGTKHAAIANDQITSEEQYAEFTRSWLTPAIPYLSDHNACYIFNSDKMLFALRDGMKQSGFKFTQLLIWIKQQQVLGRMDYLIQHELIAYGWHGRHQFHKAKDKSVLFYPRPQKSPLHPTMKPVGLLRRLILNSSGISDLVYDPFGGSGSTLIACEQTRRRCVMIELDPHYCQVIIDRYHSLNDRETRHE